MEYIVQTKNLEKKYKNINILKGIDMNIPKGSIYGLIGKNGVGKTTLIRLICGLQNLKMVHILFMESKILRKEFSKREKG